MFAAFASNIHWHWTPNQYEVGLAAWLAAYTATAAINGLHGLWHRPAKTSRHF
jgi:hypothetical protein